MVCWHTVHIISGLFWRISVYSIICWFSLGEKANMQIYALHFKIRGFCLDFLQLTDWLFGYFQWGFSWCYFFSHSKLKHFFLKTESLRLRKNLKGSGSKSSLQDAGSSWVSHSIYISRISGNYTSSNKSWERRLQCQPSYL